MLIYDKRLDKPHKRLHKMLKAREERNLYLQDKQRLIKKLETFKISIESHKAYSFSAYLFM